MSDTLVGAIIAGVVSVVGYLLVFKVNRKTASTDAAQRQIDQIQEDREADRKQFGDAMARMEERQARTENRLEQQESLFRIASDYILQLRYHISTEQPPPPPPFPPEMTQGLPGDR